VLPSRSTTRARRTHVNHARVWCVARACNHDAPPGPALRAGNSASPPAGRCTCGGGLVPATGAATGDVTVTCRSAAWGGTQTAPAALSTSALDLDSAVASGREALRVACAPWWRSFPGDRAASPRQPLLCTHCRRALVAPQQVTSEAPGLGGLRAPRRCRHRPRTTPWLGAEIGQTA